LITRVCALFLAAASLTAAPPQDRLSGHWEADMTGDGKVFTFDFDFKAKGNSLGGTVELSTLDRTFPIQKGTIHGNTISFEALGLWTGELNGQELKLTRELDYGKKQHMTAHRSHGE
jgi:hypothetical protein